MPGEHRVAFGPIKTTSAAADEPTRSVAPHPTDRRANERPLEATRQLFFKRRCHYVRRIPQDLRRANQEAVQHRTQPKTIHQQPPTHIKKIEPIPNIDSRRNKNGPPEALRFVPSSKGGTNNKKKGRRKMDIGSGVHQIRTLPTSTTLYLK